MTLLKSRVQQIFIRFWIFYEIIITLCLLPITKLTQKLFPKQIYSLIGLVNILFAFNNRTILRVTKDKYNLRQYRDSYDRTGLELYYLLASKNILIKNKKILDFGCGVGGKDFELLKENPKQILGIDLSERSIKYAKELLIKIRSKKLNFKAIDIFTMKNTNKFDTILSYTVFEHIDQNIILEILNKFSLMLKKDGRVAIIHHFYNEYFGSHLQEYIYHPWPQVFFPYNILLTYWNQKFQEDENINNNSLYTPGFRWGKSSYDGNCYMQINRLSSVEFEKIINKSNLRVEKKLFSRPSFINSFPFLPEKYFIGPTGYLLKHRKGSC